MIKIPTAQPSRGDFLSIVRKKACRIRNLLRLRQSFSFSRILAVIPAVILFAVILIPLRRIGNSAIGAGAAVAAVAEAGVAVGADCRFEVIRLSGHADTPSDGGQEIMLQRLSDCGGEHRAGADFHRGVEPRQEHEHAGEVHGADFNHAPAAEVQHGVPEKEEKGQNEEERVEECRRKGGHGKGKQALSRFLEPAEQEADQKPHQQARDDAQERGPHRTDAEAEHPEGAHAEALDEAGDTENQADDRRCAGSHRGCGYGNRNGQEGNFDDPCMKVSERGERQKQLDCGKHGNLNELQRSFFLSVDHDKILISGVPFPEFLYYLYILTYSSAFVKWKVVNSPAGTFTEKSFDKTG